MEAVGKYILIKPEEIKIESSKGGLLLSDKVREDNRYRNAEVISVGSFVPEVIKPGDQIKYDRHTGHKVDDVYSIIKVDDIVAKLWVE